MGTHLMVQALLEALHLLRRRKPGRFKLLTHGAEEFPLRTSLPRRPRVRGSKEPSAVKWTWRCFSQQTDSPSQRSLGSSSGWSSSTWRLREVQRRVCFRRRDDDAARGFSFIFISSSTLLSVSSSREAVGASHRVPPPRKVGRVSILGVNARA